MLFVPSLISVSGNISPYSYNFKFKSLELCFDNRICWLFHFGLWKKQTKFTVSIHNPLWNTPHSLNETHLPTGMVPQVSCLILHCSALCCSLLRLGLDRLCSVWAARHHIQAWRHRRSCQTVPFFRDSSHQITAAGAVNSTRTLLPDTPSSNSLCVSEEYMDLGCVCVCVTCGGKETWHKEVREFSQMTRSF